MSWAQGTTAGDETSSEAYAVLMSGENNDITATLYYDENRNSHTEGFATVGMDELMQSQAWSMNRENITTVTIDSSFANYRPTSTSFWFAYCRSLTTISGLDHLNTEAVTDMSFMFNYCAALTSLDLSFFNTENVTNFAGMLGNCSSLTSIDLSSFYTRQATDMNSMFEQSSSLVTINLSSFNTSQVTNMSYMFNECSALTTIYVGSDWSTESVTNSENMFKACTNLVGGAGTTFNSEYITATYARIDGGTSAPGYLSEQDASSTHYVLITVEGNGEVSAGMADVIRDKGDVHVADGEPLEMFFFPDEGYQLASVKIDSLDVTSQVTPATEYSAASYTIPGVYGDIAITVTFAQTSTDAEAYAALSEDNTVLTFYYDEQMTARGGMPVGPFNSEDYRGWHDLTSSITNVVFDASFANCNTITSTAYWFSGFNNLTAISGIEYLNTSNVTDMRSMFFRCFELTSLDVSNFNTSKVTDMSSMFGDCSRLTSLDVTGFNTENVTNMSGMFSRSGLTTLDVSGFKTDNVTDMSAMFVSLYNLTSLDLSNFKTDNVTNMSFMFYGCSGLTSLDLGNFNTSNVTDMNSMFNGCSGLTSLDVSNFNTSNVTNISFMFYGCRSLTTLDMSGFNTDNVTYMTRMFSGCSGLTAVFAGSGWSITNVIDGTGMFEDCTNLIGGAGTAYSADHTDHTYAHIDGGTDNPGYFTEKNASYNEAYGVLSDNNMVLTLYYDGNKSAYRDAIGLDEMMQNQQWMQNRGNILTVNFDASFANCRPTSTAYWFYGCSELMSITGIEYLVTDNVTSMSGMFMGCRVLDNINVSHFNTEKVTDMSAMFESCGALRSIDVSHFNTANVTNMGNMFANCVDLTSLDVTNFNTANVTNLFSTFTGCTGLITLDLSSFNTAKVTDMGKTFLNCSSLTTIYAGSEWSTASVTEGSDPFAGCTNLAGGAGTLYNENHVDYTYAHIDGGENNPGYFTDKNASTNVVAPEFRFEGDNLAMTTETQNASIFYKVAELPSMAEAVVDSVKNSLIVTPDGQQSTYYEHPFELKMAAVVKAIAVADNATGTIVSDTTTMVYDYEAWVNLKAAVTSGVDLYSRAQGNPNVDTQLLEQLQWALNEGDMIYNNRAQMDSFEATHFTQRINELCAQIEAQMTPTGTVATPNFSWQNDELTISTTTEGADIYYWLSDVDINGDGVITDADYAHYNNPLTIQRDVTIKAYAAKQAMDNSEIRTLDYPYTSWQTLREVISYASSVADRARHSAKVPDQEVASFEEDIAASYDMYEHRTETKDRVEEVARYLSERAYEIERMMEVEATFVDGVLTIEGNTTVAEALESFGVSTVTESIAAIVYNSSVPMANSDLQAITNPNLLIYVKSDSLAPADRNNIIVDGFAKNIVLTDVAQGNNDFYCPQAFTAEAISYTREFKQQTQIGVSRGWETIALPFNVQTIMHETRGLITPFGNNRSNTHFWLRRLTHDGLQSDSIIEANTAYLISMPNSEEYIAEYNLAGRVTFSAANVTVPVTEIIMDESANYMMAPVFQRLAAQNNLYVLNVGEQRNGYPEGSIFESNYRALLPFQAYVEHKGSNPAPPYFIVGDLGGDTTDIDATLVNSERVNSEAWYTLDGRKLQGKPTQKGVYITNGKKVIIK